jgi:V8-like Glu-specific endopeptidase
MNRPLNTLLSILIALIALVLAIPAAAAAGPVSLDVDQPAGAVSSYWTKARMRAAEPVPTKAAGFPEPSSASTSDQGSPTYVPPASPGAATDAHLLGGSASDSVTRKRALSEVLDPSVAGARAHGKVFFTVSKGIEPGNYVCSGTAINSRNRSVVLTAGHCVFDEPRLEGGKATNWMFVPAYQAGAAPFGEWTAKKLATTKQWKRDGNLRFDLGAAVVRRNEAGQQLQNVVGGRGIGFSQPRNQSFDIFGYPAKSPFDGNLEYLCASKYQGSDSSPPGSGPNTMSADCDMTGGASGGGWVVGKTVVSVVSYGYDDQPGVLYGPYFSSTAKELYKSVRGSGAKAN